MLRIAYADIRIDNILLDDRNRAVLCDFSNISPFGQPDPARPDFAVFNALDRFALVSLIFRIKYGTDPRLIITDN